MGLQLGAGGGGWLVGCITCAGTRPAGDGTAAERAGSRQRLRGPACHIATFSPLSIPLTPAHHTLATPWLPCRPPALSRHPPLPPPLPPPAPAGATPLRSPSSPRPWMPPPPAFASWARPPLPWRPWATRSGPPSWRSRRGCPPSPGAATASRWTMRVRGGGAGGGCSVCCLQGLGWEAVFAGLPEGWPRQRMLRPAASRAAPASPTRPRRRLLPWGSRCSVRRGRHPCRRVRPRLHPQPGGGAGVLQPHRIPGHAQGVVGGRRQGHPQGGGGGATRLAGRDELGCGARAQSTDYPRAGCVWRGCGSPAYLPSASKLAGPDLAWPGLPHHVPPPLPSPPCPAGDERRRCAAPVQAGAGRGAWVAHLCHEAGPAEPPPGGAAAGRQVGGQRGGEGRVGACRKQVCAAVSSMPRP